MTLSTQVYVNKICKAIQKQNLLPDQNMMNSTRLQGPGNDFLTWGVDKQK